MLYLYISVYTGLHIDKLFRNLTTDIYYHKQKLKHKSSIGFKSSERKLEGDCSNEVIKCINKNNDDDFACCSAII